MTQADIMEIEAIRQALQLDDLKASQHIHYAIEALKLSGIAVNKSAIAEQSKQDSSAEMTMKMLRDKYSK